MPFLRTGAHPALPSRSGRRRNRKRTTRCRGQSAPGRRLVPGNGSARQSPTPYQSSRPCPGSSHQPAPCPCRAFGGGRQQSRRDWYSPWRRSQCSGPARADPRLRHAEVCPNRESRSTCAPASSTAGTVPRRNRRDWPREIFLEADDRLEAKPLHQVEAALGDRNRHRHPRIQ